MVGRETGGGGVVLMREVRRFGRRFGILRARVGDRTNETMDRISGGGRRSDARTDGRHATTASSERASERAGGWMDVDAIGTRARDDGDGDGDGWIRVGDAGPGERARIDGDDR